MTRLLSFIVPGPPVPKARPRLASGRVYTPATTQKYEALVKWAAMAARPRDWPLDGQYTLSARIFYPDARRRDLSNVVKAIEDGMNGVAYRDDVQIVAYASIKSEIDRKAPRVEVLLAYEPPTVTLVKGTVRKTKVL